MMHEKMVEEFIEKQTATWLEEDLLLMEQEFSEKKSEIIKSLDDVISTLFIQACELQEKGLKGAAAFLCISFLRSNILEDKWQYRLDLYDGKFYLDRQECSSCWELEFVWNYLKKRLDHLDQVIRTGMYANKVRPHHFSQVRLVMAEQYHEVAMAFTQAILEETTKLTENGQLIKLPNFKVLMGEYLDKNFLLYEEQSKRQEETTD